MEHNGFDANNHPEVFMEEVWPMIRDAIFAAQLVEDQTTTRMELQLSRIMGTLAKVIEWQQEKIAELRSPV